MFESYITLCVKMRKSIVNYGVKNFIEVSIVCKKNRQKSDTLDNFFTPDKIN